MEEKYDKYLKIIIVLIIILTLGLICYIAYDKYSSPKQTEESSELENSENVENTQGNSTQEGEPVNFEKTSKSYVASIKKGECLNAIELEYYSLTDTYEVLISGIEVNDKKINYRYVSGEKFETHYVNNLKVKEETNAELLLSSVCSYDKYLLVSEIWEGQPVVSLINSDGEIKKQFISSYEYKNGQLEVEGINCINNECSLLEYKLYTLNLNEDELKDNIVNRKEFSCSSIDAQVDYESSEDKVIKDYCLYEGLI